MNDKFRFVLALIAFLALVASLELVAGYAFYSILEPENQARLIAMLAPQAELLAEMGLLLLLILGPLVAVTEVSRAMGPAKMRDLFLSPPGQASAGDDRAKSTGSGAS